MKKIGTISLAVVVVVLVGGLYWFAVTKGGLTGLKEYFTQNASVGNSVYTESFKSKVNTVSFRYPKGYEVKELTESGGNVMLIQNAQTSEAVQIFVSPFADPVESFTEEKIRRDIPDLEMKNVEKINVDGINALAFSSDNPAFQNDSYDVWLVSNGKLYQVSTGAALKDFVRGFIETMRFK
jgi:hypothetical protein